MTGYYKMKSSRPAVANFKFFIFELFMLIPVSIGLIISSLFLNLGFFTQADFSMPSQGRPARSGRVLGASEAPGGSKALIDQQGSLNKAIANVLAEAKSLSRPRLYQLPQLDQPLRQKPPEAADKQASVSADFDFSAPNGVILDDGDSSLFFAKRPDRPWPIASITKLFTAYTFLDYNPGWETGYVIKPEDKREGGKIYLFNGDKVTVKDLFYFSLVGSDNTATEALVRSTGLSEAEFVKKMNEKLQAMGFKNTRLVDPVGLKDGNVSTAREVALFAKIALKNADISRASLTKKYEFYTEQGKKKSVVSTNELLGGFPAGGISILGGKTGYVDAAGYCLVSQFKNYQGRAITTVVLGADDNNGRFSLTKKLVDLFYKNLP